MLLQKTLPLPAKVNLLSRLAAAAGITALTAISALTPGCGAPLADELDKAENEHVSEQVDEAQADLRYKDPCALVRCRSGYSCEAQDGHAVCVPDPPPPACETDADCSLVASYCGGCDCIAVAPGESAPVCHGDEVACVQWPCVGRSAACVEGTCTVTSGSSM